LKGILVFNDKFSESFVAFFHCEIDVVSLSHKYRFFCENEKNNSNIVYQYCIFATYSTKTTP
jgi:hypothetical protein